MTPLLDTECRVGGVTVLFSLCAKKKGRKKKKRKKNVHMYVFSISICELPEIPISCAYFEILLVVCEMIDPLLGALSQCHIPHPICRRQVFPMQ